MAKIDKSLWASKEIDDDELNEAAGGTSAQLKQIATAFGHPNASANQVRKALSALGIDVVHWNTGGMFSGGKEAIYREKVPSNARGLVDSEGNLVPGYLTHREVLKVVNGYMSKTQTVEDNPGDDF